MNRAVVDPQFIVRYWGIDGHPNYFFEAAKQLYQSANSRLANLSQRVHTHRYLTQSPDARHVPAVGC